MENVFEKFNHAFFDEALKKGKLNVKWFDRSITIILGNKTVEIILSDLGTHNHFNCYVVRVTNTSTGVEATRKVFYFKDHISRWIQIGNDQRYYHAWYNNNKLEWYIDKPFETKSMVEKMFDYISQYI